MKEKTQAFIYRTRKHKVTITVMIISFVIAFCSVFFTVTFNKNIAREYNDKMNYEYASQVSMQAGCLPGQGVDILKNVVDCNLKLLDTSVYLDEAGYMCIMDVIIDSEWENYPFVEGGMPSDITAISEPSVILGINKKEFTYVEKEDRYIRINGEAYKVLGFISSSNSVIMDDKVVTFVDNMTNGLRAVVEGNMSINLSLQLESNKLDCRKEAEKLVNILSVYYQDNNSIVFTSTAAPQLPAQRMNTIVYIFSFLAVLTAVKMWLWERQKEIAIRSVYGYRIIDLFKMLFRDLNVYAVISFVISILVLIIFNIVFSNFCQEYNTAFDIVTLLGMMVGVVLTSLVVCVLQVFKIRRLNPIELLKKE